MNSFAHCILAIIICTLSFQSARSQTFHMEHDTVYANAYLCPIGNFMDSVAVTYPDTVHLNWRVLNTNFPSDWLSPSTLAVVDNNLAYSNFGNSLWNGTTGDTHGATYSPFTASMFNLSMYMNASNTPGTYWMEIQLTDTATSYSRYIWFFITRVPTVLLPNAGNITGPSDICMSTPAVLSDSFVAAGTWSASNTNISISLNGLTASLAAVFPGIDTISYTVSNSCGTSVATKIVSVSAVPYAGAIIGPSVVCSAASVSLIDSPALNGTWSAVNGAATLSSSHDTAIITGVTAGIDTLKYSVTNSCGTAVANKTITVDPPANAGLLTGPSAVCMGSAVTLTDTVAGGTWSAINNNATISGGSATGIEPGIDTLIYTVTDQCGYTASVSKPITINALPDPQIASTGSMLSTTLSYTTYQWLLGGALIAGANHATLAPSASGSYSVTVTDSNGCSATSSSFNFVVSVPSVWTPVSDIVVYPDPASDELFISSAKTIGDISIVNSLGRVIYANNYNQTKVTVDITSLPPGLYFFRSNSSIRRFIKL